MMVSLYCFLLNCPRLWPENLCQIFIFVLVVDSFILFNSHETDICLLKMNLLWFSFIAIFHMNCSRLWPERDLPT